MAGSYQKYADYQRTLADLESGKLKAVYFGRGADYYLYQGFIGALRKAFSIRNGSHGDLIQRWGADLKTASDVSALLEGGDLFSSASLIMLHEIQDASTTVKTKLAEMLSDLPPGTTVMVHYPLEDFRKAAKWLEALQKVGQNVPLNQPDLTQLPMIIRDIGRKFGLTLDQAAVLRLIELTSGELAIIANELEKIVLYLDEGQREVTQSIVDTVAGNLENAHVSQFVEAVSQRDARLAMQTLVEIDHQGKEGLPYLVAMLYGRLTQLMALRETAEARKSINREGTSAYWLGQLEPVSKNYSLAELQSATRQLAELDLGFRLGSADLLTSFSTWISRVV